MSRSIDLPVLLLTAALAGPAGAAAPDAAPTDPAQYAGVIDNPWFPLTPGTTLIFQGSKDDRRAAREVEVTGKTKTVGGVICLIVEDRVALGGKPAEKTIGYFAQDVAGNVWYFGEESQELDNRGNVIKSESWQTGVDGATPNLIMSAHPEIGDHFSHPYTNANTEVLSLDATVEVPYGTFSNALQIKDWNPEESDTLSQIFYLPGIGEARNINVKGSSEDLKLVEVRTGG